jgi:hypothetical protein
MIEVVTDDGKNNILYCAFSGAVGANQFSHMAAGKGTTDPTIESTALDDECTSADGNYSRALLSNTFNSDYTRVKSEAIFDLTNITESTIINEIGIVDRDTLGEGVFYCICRIPAMTKSSENQLRIVVTSTLEDV